MALGAERTAVLAMVLRQGLRLAAAGLGIGAGLSVLLTRLLVSLLFEVRPTDLTTSAAAAAVLAGIALAASAVPARRASRMDLLVALRSQ